MSEDDKRPRTVGRQFDRAEMLVHMTENAHVAGDAIGGWALTCWAADWSPQQKAVEDILEAARPAEAPKRGACVYATSHMDLVRSWLNNDYPIRVYKVRVPEEARAFGHVDMRYLDWMLRNGPSPAHAMDYWNRLSNPNPLGVASWEVLADRVVVAEEAPRDRVREVRATNIGISLTLADLFKPVG